LKLPLAKRTYAVSALERTEGDWLRKALFRPAKKRTPCGVLFSMTCFLPMEKLPKAA